MCGTPLDICLVVDSSGSIRDQNPPDGSFDNWELVLNFLVSAVTSIGIGADATRFGLVLYSADARLEIELGEFNDIASMTAAIVALPHLNSFTNTYEALELTKNSCFGGPGDRPEAQNVVILVTDGVPTRPENEERGRELAIQAGQEVLDAGIITYSVGITDNIDVDLLRTLSSEPKELDRNYFTSPNFEDLENVLDALLGSTCEVRTTPPPQCKFIIM